VRLPAFAWLRLFDRNANVKAERVVFVLSD
jgi:hypothetical protein